MLTTRQKFSLMLMYMRPVLIISGLGTLSAISALSMMSVESMKDNALPMTLLKIIILAISTLLFTMMSSKDRKFFYINIGISTKKLMRLAIVLDMLAYFVMITLIIVIRHAVS